MSRCVVWICAGSIAAIASLAQGQSFPTRPIRIVTSGAGSSNDFNSRLIAQGITAGLGQPVVVENHGSGVLPTEFVAMTV